MAEKTDIEKYIDKLREIMKEDNEAFTRWEDRVKQLPETIPLDDKELADRVSSGIVDLREFFKTVDSKRKAQARPWDDRKKAVQGEFKPLLDGITSLATTLKTMLDDHAKRARAKADEEARKIEEAARKKAAEQDDAARAEAAAMEAEAEQKREAARRTATPGGARTHTTSRLVVNVTDLDALIKAAAKGDVPQHWLAPNLTAIRADVRDLELEEAPGLSIETVETVIAR